VSRSRPPDTAVRKRRCLLNRQGALMRIPVQPRPQHRTSNHTSSRPSPRTSRGTSRPRIDRFGIGQGDRLAPLRAPRINANLGVLRRNRSEILLDNLLSPNQFVAAAHRKIIADWIASRLWGCGQTAFPALAVLCRSRSLRVDLPTFEITRSDRFVCLDCFGTPAESNPKM
jgi:hypothetical protein